MKRLLLVLLVLMFFVVVLGAIEMENDELSIRLTFPPRTVDSYSFYDYMNGGYNGYPVRLHNVNGENLGFYLTFFTQQNKDVRRSQRWAYHGMNGGQLETGELTSLGNYNEGFGSLAIHPSTGNAIFAWHAWTYSVDPPNSDILSNYVKWDSWNIASTPGVVMSEYYEYAENQERDPDGSLKLNFIWPVLDIGPSPISGKHRIYAFHGNSGPSFQVSENSDSGFVPSSTAMVAFADIGPDDFFGNPSDLDWREVNIPYLDAIHNWNPPQREDPSDGVVRWPFARVYLSYTVSENKVVLAGYISGDTFRNGRPGDWSWMQDLGMSVQPHNFVVLLSEDYGETFHPYITMIEYSKEPSFQFTFNPSELAALDSDERNHLLEAQEAYFDVNNDHKMESQLLNNKTIFFDRAGNLHIPAFFNEWHHNLEAGARRSWTELNTLNTVIFSKDAGFSVTNVHPRPVNNEYVNRPIFPFDLNDDGYADIRWETTASGQKRYEPWERILPVFHHDVNNETASHWFNSNQLRMTYDGEQTMVAIWMDSAKAFRNANYSDGLPEYRETAEMVISLSVDMGKTWSQPYYINYMNHPEFFSNPASNKFSYVYPADKLIRTLDDQWRLYIMYNDDNGYGPGVPPHGVGPDNGTAIRFVAIDIAMGRVSDGDNPPVPMPNSLSQNYPNPFNPSTTINFNVSTPGRVKLSVYNIRGQLVDTLKDEVLDMGQHSVIWDGTDYQNQSVASGVYFYRLESNGTSETKRMVLMK